MNTLLSILSFIGALGLFIFGMKVMSEALQKVAGGKMRRTLSAMAANKYRALFSGFLITSLIQSSSATTVLLVSFVNAGMLTLAESVGVIMGANIGTTITAWLVVLGVGKLSISSLAFPGLALGVPLLFAKKEKLKIWGEVGVGFCLLFMGIYFMQQFMPNMRENPEMLNFLNDFSLQNQSFWPRLGTLLMSVGVGFLLTVLLQSSSASTAVTIVLCYQGWISLPLALALVLGENLGTTITANIASVVANVHAKRAARIHFIINFIGLLWALVFFDGLVHFTTQSVIALGAANPLTNISSIPIALAFFHSTFNIVNVALLFGFSRPLVRFTTGITPARAHENELYSLDYLGSGLLATPELSIVEARKELIKFTEVMRRAFKYVPLMITEVEDKEVFEHSRQLRKYEDISDRMEREISQYLNNPSQRELSLAAVVQVRRMLEVASYLERIGDKYLEISKSLTLRREKRAYFTPEMRKRVIFFCDRVREALDLMVKNMGNPDEEVDLRPVDALEKEINELHQSYRKEHIKHSEKGNYKIQSGMYYSDLLADLQRIADHAASISRCLIPKEVKE